MSAGGGLGSSPSPWDSSFRVRPPTATLELDWWTISTKHFRVHYDRTLEPIARRVASLAETIHERVADALGYKPSELTEIVLTDDTESANGSATALPYNTIRLYVTAPSDLSTIGDYDDWYTELVTHEYTHITHLDKISGLPRSVNAILGKTLAPNQTLPRWITEGIAVVSESYHTTGGRIRSNLFDMYLRADVIEDNIATIDQFSNDAYRWPQGDLWYLYGSKFLQWITDVYGINTIRAISADGSSEIIPWGLNRTVRRATGLRTLSCTKGSKTTCAVSMASRCARFLAADYVWAPELHGMVATSIIPGFSRPLCARATPRSCSTIATT